MCFQFTVVVLRFISNCGVRVSFLASKTKIAPLKKLTFPRLEFLGCLLPSKLIKQVLEGVNGRIEVDDKYCCSDSKVAFNEDHLWPSGIYLIT